jgi:hypothetical protein
METGEGWVIANTFPGTTVDRLYPKASACCRTVRRIAQSNYPQGIEQRGEDTVELG